MNSPDHLDRISTILAAAPQWARLALTSADARLRARGADELASFLLRRMEEPVRQEHKDQLSLPIAG